MRTLHNVHDNVYVVATAVQNIYPFKDKFQNYLLGNYPCIQMFYLSYGF